MKKTNSSRRIRLYFLAAFFILLYFLFPYLLFKNFLFQGINSVLRENRVHFQLNAASFSPYWFSGIQFNNLKIIDSDHNTSKSSFDMVTFRLSILPLFIGRININSTFYQHSGHFNAAISMPLFATLSGDIAFRKVELNFSDFAMDDFAHLSLDYIKNSNIQNSPSMALVLPVISKLTMGGFLSGNIIYHGASYDPSAQIQTTLKEGFISINNEALAIPTQNFSYAVVNIDWDGSNIHILKGTGLKSQDLFLRLDGSFEKPMDNVDSPYQVHLQLNLDLSGQLANNFSFLLPQILKCPVPDSAGNSLHILLEGTTNKLSCQL